MIPHQANIRIIESAMKRLNIPMESLFQYFTKQVIRLLLLSPSIVDAVQDGRIQEGDNLLLVGFGAGMTSASAIVKWGGST